MDSINRTLDYWYSFYGYPYIGDIIAAYVLTPVWSLSFLFSVLNMVILLKPAFFASNFFNFMRLYVANCLILSVISLTLILANTRRFFTNSNTYEAVFYYNYVFMSAENTLFLFSSCIEICMVVERIIYLLPSFKRIKLVGFKNFFLALFMMCLLVNVPEMFLFEPAFADVQLGPNTVVRMWYVDVASFTFSLAGKIFFYFGYIFRDILPMVLKIILNFISVYLVRNYVKNKKKIRAASSHAVKFDRKQTYIALVMNALSLIEHLLYIASYFLFYIYEFDLSTLVFVVALFFIALKHFLTFFILFGFNNLYRNEVLKMFFKN